VTRSSRLEYEKRVNRVIDHVRQHVAENLSLAGLARVAAFSPFHFDRVFKAITGETLFGFAQRLRIERAAGALRVHPDQSVLEVALDHGFASAATFARAFRAHFGMSATQWRAGGAERWRRRRNPGKQVRKPGKAVRACRRETPRDRREEEFMSVEIRDLFAHHVAFMRYVGPYGAVGIPALWIRLAKWMAAHRLGSPTSITLAVAYDDPSITAPDKCRYDACVVVPPDFRPDRLVEVMDVQAGRYAVARFTGGAHEIVDAWDRVFAAWLPNSGYEPDDRPCFELYRGDPTVDAKAQRFRCDLCLPVRPL
jgi:AraC family transcriptional regulator